MLTFHVSHNALSFIHEESTINWRELEDRLHDDYPIKGVGIKATLKNLKDVDAENGGFLHTSEDLNPGDVPDELSCYPYNAASAAYMFTLLEGFGDTLVNLVNPTYLNDRKAWHHAVYGDANLKNKGERDKVRKGFAKPFQRKPTRIPVFAVKRLVQIKSLRNQFMHEGSTEINFNDFFSSVVATVIFLYFFLVPKGEKLSVYPYYDYHDKWK